jgi:cyanophycin synthetase
MRINSIRAISGPNIYSHNPVLVMNLDLEELAEKESYEVPGFADRLIDLLPGVRTHHCAKGRPGGFIERLVEGTYFGHIVEHVALELTDLAGFASTHGKTRRAGHDPCCYNVVIEYKAEHVTRHLLRAAVGLVETLVAGRPFGLEALLKECGKIAADTELGPSARAIVEAAERRGIPCMRVGPDSLVQLGHGRNRKFIQAAMTSRTSAIAVEIAQDKELTKALLSAASIPVPAGKVVRTEGEARAALGEILTPVVVKPLDGRQGQGVSLNLSTQEQVVEAFQIARRYSSCVIVEELFEGQNYRVLVVGGKAVAASCRRAPQVVGDGARTIAELIEATNKEPLRGDGHGKPLTRIARDAILLAHLQKHGLGLEHIPRRGEVVSLREGVNLSTGGTAADVTHIMHPQVARLCERAARVVGLDVCGVDLVLKEIASPIEKGDGGVIELNAAPGLRMHLTPSEGEARDVGEAIINMLYPEGSPARIPIVSVTGTNGKTTVTRMIGHVFSEMGKTVGMTTTDGIFIGGECVERGDTTGPRSARAVLSDPSVEVAVLETARGGIARRGLGYDWSDVAVITNVQPDHIGQDGIKSLNDLVYIKSLVAERVREGGTLILNADDERLAQLMKIRRVRKVKKNVVYFSLHSEHLVIKRHLAAGGIAYYVKDGWIIEAKGSSEHRIVQTHSIPITLGGRAEFHVANAMAAVAGCRAAGASRHQVSSALAGFRSEQHNPGRANLYQVADGYVLLDYGHNPDAFKAVCHMASQWGGRRVTGVLGALGDRDNSIIEEAGRVAARGFDKLVIKEDKDLRGRASDEVAGLLTEAVKKEAPERACIISLDEREAISIALREMEPDEIVVIFFDKLDFVLETLAEYDAVPVATIEGLAPRQAYSQAI